MVHGSGLAVPIRYLTAIMVMLDGNMSKRRTSSGRSTLTLIEVDTLAEEVDNSMTVSERRRPSLHLWGNCCAARRNGNYGLPAFQVTQRQHEMGIRVTLWRTAPAHWESIASQTLVVMGVRVILVRGLGAVFVAGGTGIRSLLHGISTEDPNLLAR